MKSLKSQISMEYVIIVGIVLVITIPILYYAITESNTHIKLNQADDAVNVIARAADSVYSLGEGSKNYIWITIPSSVVATSVGNKTIQIKLNIFGGVSDIYAETKANVTGSLPASKGTYKVLVEALNNGQVAVWAYDDKTAPSVISTSPSGLVRNNDTTLTAITDENAVCKYNDQTQGDDTFDNMLNTFSGTTFTHQSYVGELSEGNYIYYARCSDSSGNNMSSSATIDFIINLTSDITPPFVTNTSVDDDSVLIDEYVCINTTAEDNSSISNVWVMVTSPLDEPFIKVHNFSMSGSSLIPCAGTDDDNIYGVNVQMQAVGTWYINTSYASDSEGNIGEEMPHPNIEINVSEDVYGSLTYKPVTGGTYLSKTPDITVADTDLAQTDDVTSGVTDDDKNTLGNEVFKLGGGKYQGFIFELNEAKGAYSAFRIRIKSDKADVLPYNLVAYGYASDGNNVVLTGTTDFSITNVRSATSRGENEADITTTIENAGYSNIKIRIVPRADMDGQTADITEVDFGVG